MPYTIKQARNTDYYKNVQDADEHKLLKSLEEEKKRAAISGSALDATDPLRDDNGYLLSYEDPKGQTARVYCFDIGVSSETEDI